LRHINPLPDVWAPYAARLDEWLTTCREAVLGGPSLTPAQVDEVAQLADEASAAWRRAVPLLEEAYSATGFARFVASLVAACAGCHQDAARQRAARAADLTIALGTQVERWRQAVKEDVAWLEAVCASSKGPGFSPFFARPLWPE